MVSGAPDSNSFVEEKFDANFCFLSSKIANFSSKIAKFAKNRFLDIFESDHERMEKLHSHYFGAHDSGHSSLVEVADTQENSESVGESGRVAGDSAIKKSDDSPYQHPAYLPIAQSMLKKNFIKKKFCFLSSKIAFFFSKIINFLRKSGFKKCCES